MCLIVVNPGDAPAMTHEEFLDAWYTHSDGGGLMFVEQGILRVWKPYWKAQKFYSAFLRARGRADGPVVLHFRWRTHGTCTKVNTHPFLIHREQIGLVHNGVLPLEERTGIREFPWAQTRSDTRVWAEDVFDKEYTALEIFKGEWGPRYDQLLGQKLVFLGQGKPAPLFIWGEHTGSWIDGRWYSNRVHVWKSKTTVVNVHGGYGELWDYDRNKAWPTAHLAKAEEDTKVILTKGYRKQRYSLERGWYDCDGD